MKVISFTALQLAHAIAKAKLDKDYDDLPAEKQAACLRTARHAIAMRTIGATSPKAREQRTRTILREHPDLSPGQAQVIEQREFNERDRALGATNLRELSLQIAKKENMPLPQAQIEASRRMKTWTPPKRSAKQIAELQAFVDMLDDLPKTKRAWERGHINLRETSRELVKVRGLDLGTAQVVAATIAAKAETIKCVDDTKRLDDKPHLRAERRKLIPPKSEVDPDAFDVAESELRECAARLQSLAMQSGTRLTTGQKQLLRTLLETMPEIDRRTLKDRSDSFTLKPTLELSIVTSDALAKAVHQLQDLLSTNVHASALPELRYALRMGPLALPDEMLQQCARLRELCKVADSKGIAEGVDLNEYMRPIAHALRMPVGATWGDAINAVETLIKAEVAKHSQPPPRNAA